jgi:hypothetical protein
VASIASIVLQTNKGLLDHLEKNSQLLEQQLDQYTFIANQFDTKFCYETIKTTKYGVSMMVCSNIISPTGTKVNDNAGGGQIFGSNPGPEQC